MQNKKPKKEINLILYSLSGMVLGIIVFLFTENFHIPDRVLRDWSDPGNRSFGNKPRFIIGRPAGGLKDGSHYCK